MSAQPDNIGILRRGYEALAGGDFDAVLDFLDPQIEIRDRPESPDPGTYLGHEGALAAFGVTTEMFEELELLPEQFLSGGGYVVVAIRLVARGKESGVPVEDRVVHLWKMRNGKALSLQVYSEMADALEVAGL